MHVKVSSPRMPGNLPQLVEEHRAICQLCRLTRILLTWRKQQLLAQSYLELEAVPRQTDLLRCIELAVAYETQCARQNTSRYDV